MITRQNVYAPSERERSKDDISALCCWNGLETCFLTRTRRLFNGEGPERNWAQLNTLATATREMGMGYRHEVLEDHMNDINFKKMATLRTFSGFILFVYLANSYLYS